MKESGVAWIGKIPDAWSVTKFKKTILSSNGGEVIDKGYWNTGEELLYTCQITPMKSNYENFPDKKRTKKGDLLLTRNATPYIFIPKENSIYSNVVQRVKLRNGYDPGYIKYATLEGARALVANGDTIPSYNMEVWRNIFIPDIPYDLQKKISQYLDIICGKFDKTLDDARRSIESYKELKHSIINEAVTKGIDSSVEYKDSEIEWIGKIPKHWRVLRHKNVMRKQKTICESYGGEDIISLTMAGVIVRDLNAGGKMPATFDGYQFVEPGDLLLCLFDIDVTPRCVGLVRNNGLTSSAYSRFKLYDNFYAPYYDYLLRSIDDTKSFLHLAKNLRSTLTESDFGAIPTIAPPYDEQKRIADYLDEKCKDIDNLINIKERFVKELESYKKSTIYEYITGKKEVPEL